MGQKVHPLGFRLGVFEDWKAHWFAKKDYGKEIIEDFEIRKFLKDRLNFEDVSKIVIDKAGENIKITVFSSRPGIVIGKRGKDIEKLKADIYKKLNKNVEISVQEIRKPEVDANLIAKSIAEQLVKRASYKRVMKRAGFAAMRSGVRGIKICCGGRLAGAEIARSEWLRLGSVPLHTLRSKIDFASAAAKTTYGLVGVKVWVCSGEY